MVALERTPARVDGRPAPTARRHRRFGLFAVVAVVLAALATPPSAVGQEGGPPWRDLERAQRQLDAATERVLASTDRAVALEQEIEELRSSESEVDAATVELATRLQETRKQARDLAVESYMTGGALPDAVYLLDAPTASEFAFRSTLLSEGTDAVADRTSDYLELREDATANAVALAERLERLERQRSRVDDEIRAAEVAVEQAEWVVSIATIHRRAEEELARTGRPDPTADQWQALRECESGDVYTINTGNGFYGAYQYTIGTWHDLGGIGLASHAPPEEQDARARLLYAQRGAQPWPICGRYLPGG